MRRRLARMSFSAARRTRIGLLTLALMLLPAAVASAEPDFSATLNAANPKFTWESSGSSLPEPTPSVLLDGEFSCKSAPSFECEYVLLSVETAGELTLTLDGTEGIELTDPSSLFCGASQCSVDKDIDAYLYRSDPAGQPVGGDLTGRDCGSGRASETCKVAVKPGFYVLEVDYHRAQDAHYVGTAELVPDQAAPPAAEPQVIELGDCNLTLYYFKDAAERLQALVPPGYRVQPYAAPWPYPASPLVTTEGSATIAAAAYDCDRIEIPGSSPGPGIFTLLSVLVYPAGHTDEQAAPGPATSDFYVLWIHANNPQLVDALASRGMPAELVEGMTFEKPVQSLGVRVAVPWSPGAYELSATGFEQDVFHPHDNTFSHVAADGRLARMDFLTTEARDQHCLQQSDDHAVECGKLSTQAGTPVAGFFGAAQRSADAAFDHDPLERSWFVLQCTKPRRPQRPCRP